MIAALNVLAVLVAGLCVGGYVLAGELAVLTVVLAGVGSLAWRVAAASRPRPGRARRSPGALRFPGVHRSSGVSSGVRIGHERDAHVVGDERGQREGVEHLVEPEPPR
ncbi:hypothetical protein GCM10010507_51120 [Streptomyces cinnamoneus]|uniref:Uncharacterized protein n=1 Tax=Streptomyces cinnamoneus TaxID=53446 RepID=A0A918WP07_STRCJ|nr:hypothetical protein GCM10010507_51120 [Streptomyces cinnamoneus]